MCCTIRQGSRPSTGMALRLHEEAVSNFVSEADTRRASGYSSIRDVTDNIGGCCGAWELCGQVI